MQLNEERVQHKHHLETLRKQKRLHNLNRFRIVFRQLVRIEPQFEQCFTKGSHNRY